VVDINKMCVTNVVGFYIIATALGAVVAPEVKTRFKIELNATWS